MHTGRVNSRLRLAYAISIGCDSTHGSEWAASTTRTYTNLSDGLQACAAGAQLRLNTLTGRPAPSTRDT